MKLKGMTWDHPRGFDCVVAASADYAALHGVAVEWDKRSLQAFADAPIDQLAEEYDFIVLDHPHVGQIAQTNALLPLPFDAAEQAFVGGSAESYIWHESCWAYALDAACQMAVLRPDLLLQQPKHWEDFAAPDAAQFRPLTPLLPVDAFDMFMTLVAGRGEETLPVSKREFVSERNGLNALDVLRNLFNLGPSEQIRMNPIADLETLSSTDDFACSPCLFGYVNYARPNFRNNQLSYFDLPLSKGFQRPRAILGGAGIGVSAKTSAPEAAIAFARWLTSEPVQSGVYLNNNGQPAHRATWQKMALDADVSGFFQGGWHTIDNAWPRPRAPWFLGFVDEVCEIFPDFFAKAIPGDAFLTSINALYQKYTTEV
jgi:multiple sugar transport system substrate-binding protein